MFTVAACISFLFYFIQSSLSSFFFFIFFFLSVSLCSALSPSISSQWLGGGGCGLRLWVGGCSVAMGFGGRGVWVVGCGYVLQSRLGKRIFSRASIKGHRSAITADRSRFRCGALRIIWCSARSAIGTPMVVALCPPRTNVTKSKASLVSGCPSA